MTEESTEVRLMPVGEILGLGEVDGAMGVGVRDIEGNIDLHDAQLWDPIQVLLACPTLSAFKEAVKNAGGDPDASLSYLLDEGLARTFFDENGIDAFADLALVIEIESLGESGDEPGTQRFSVPQGGIIELGIASVSVGMANNVERPFLDAVIELAAETGERPEEVALSVIHDLPQLLISGGGYLVKIP